MQINKVLKTHHGSVWYLSQNVFILSQDSNSSSSKGTWNVLRGQAPGSHACLSLRAAARGLAEDSVCWSSLTPFSLQGTQALF